MELKGSKTEANLTAAFAGESQARNNYTYYASKATEEGYRHIGELFTETAENERAHAKIWFRLLHGGSIPDTATNLADAAAGERYEWTQMYAQFAQVAREEGFDNIARLFEQVGGIEKQHEERFQTLLREGYTFVPISQLILPGECGQDYSIDHTGRQCPGGA